MLKDILNLLGRTVFTSVCRKKKKKKIQGPSTVREKTGPQNVHQKRVETERLTYKTEEGSG